jgi:hypothetical protein
MATHINGMIADKEAKQIIQNLIVELISAIKGAVTRHFGFYVMNLLHVGSQISTNLRWTVML